MLGLWVATEVALFNVPLAAHLAEFVVIDSGLEDFWHRIDAAGEADDERSHGCGFAIALKNLHAIVPMTKLSLSELANRFAENVQLLPADIFLRHLGLCSGAGMQERAVLGKAIGIGFGVAEIDREIIARDHFANFLPILQSQGHFKSLRCS